MSTETVKNAADTWVNQASATKNYNTKTRLNLRNSASNNRYAWLYFNRPFPIGTNVISAKLRLYAAGAWAGSNTLTARLATGKWSVNRINYNNMPGTTSSASVTQSGTADGALYEIDVTTMMQTISAGGQFWYGFRIETNSSTNVQIHASESTTGSLRPALWVQWNDAPEEPALLRPGGGRWVNGSAPFLSWEFSDVNGDTNLQAVQVQFGSSQVLLDAGTATYDTGTVPTSEPQLDMSKFTNAEANPGFESATMTSWGFLNATIAQSGAQARSGSFSGAITATAAGGVTIFSPKYAITSGTTASGSLYVRSAATTHNWTINVRFLDASNAVLADGTSSGSVASTTSSWTKLTAPSAVAPAGTATYQLRVLPAGSWAAGEVQYVDDVDVSWGSGASFAPIASGSTFWWRCRNQDGAGFWSPWADSVQSGNLSPITVTGLTLNASTTTITDYSPTLSWTTGVRTQQSYLVYVTNAADPFTWIWDSGKVTSANTSQNIPAGVLKDASASYIFAVWVWDDQPREAIPTAPVFVEAKTSALPFAYSGSVTNVTSLAFTSDLLKPVGTLTFNRTTAPDSFLLQQSDDGGTTWYYLEERLPAELTTGGTSYAWQITKAKQYVSHQWRVLSVVGGVQSTGVTVSGTIARLCPVLMRQDGTDPCFFMNPERDRHRFSVQSLGDRMGGPPVLVTQRTGKQGKQGGHIRGRFVPEAPGAPYTSAVQRASFLSLEEDSGLIMTLAIANETLDVVAYNFEIDTITDTSGVTYLAEFDWIEQ